MRQLQGMQRSAQSTGPRIGEDLYLEAGQRQVVRLVHPGVLHIASHFIQGPVGEDREEVDDDRQPQFVDERDHHQGQGSRKDDEQNEDHLGPWEGEGRVRQLPAASLSLYIQTAIWLSLMGQAAQT